MGGYSLSDCQWALTNHRCVLQVSFDKSEIIIQNYIQPNSYANLRCVNKTEIGFVQPPLHSVPDAKKNGTE